MTTPKLQTGSGYDDLNAIREDILLMATYTPLRRRYRELRRALANIAEDVAATCSTTADIRGVEQSIRELRAEVEEKKCQTTSFGRMPRAQQN